MIRDRGPCLVPGCAELERTRGLCGTHYVYAIRVIKSGMATWPELEAAGKSKPMTRSRKPRTGWFVTRPGPEKPQG